MGWGCRRVNVREDQLQVGWGPVWLQQAECWGWTAGQQIYNALPCSAAHGNFLVQSFISSSPPLSPNHPSTRTLATAATVSFVIAHDTSRCVRRSNPASSRVGHPDLHSRLPRLRRSRWPELSQKFAMPSISVLWQISSAGSWLSETALAPLHLWVA